MQKLHYPLKEASIIRRAVGWGDENLLRPFIQEKDLKKALAIYRQHHRLALVKNSRLFPQTEKVLSYLKNKGYKLAVASNRPTRFSWILIRHLKIAKYFDYVLCADKLRYIKPHPEILNKIMQRFHLKPKEAVYIGDMTIDVQAGKRAKLKTVIVTGGSSTTFEIKKEKPYRIIKRLKDLLRIL